MSKRTINPRNNKTNTLPITWKNTRTRVQSNNSVSSKFERKLRLLQRQNSRLISKIKTFRTREQDLINLQIKYLKLKDRVLETEEKLLLLGINTTEYSAFNSDDDDDDDEEEDTETNDQNKLEVLLECKLDTENQIPVEEVFYYPPSSME